MKCRPSGQRKMYWCRSLSGIICEWTWCRAIFTLLNVLRYIIIVPRQLLCKREHTILSINAWNHIIYFAFPDNIAVVIKLFRTVDFPGTVRREIQMQYFKTSCFFVLSTHKLKSCWHNIGSKISSIRSITKCKLLITRTGCLKSAQKNGRKSPNSPYNSNKRLSPSCVNCLHSYVQLVIWRYKDTWRINNNHFA
jgi:hypothetical protein